MQLMRFAVELQLRVFSCNHIRPIWLVLLSVLQDATTSIEIWALEIVRNSKNIEES